MLSDPGVSILVLRFLEDEDLSSACCVCLFMGGLYHSDGLWLEKIRVIHTNFPVLVSHTKSYRSLYDTVVGMTILGLVKWAVDNNHRMLVETVIHQTSIIRVLCATNLARGGYLGLLRQYHIFPYREGLNAAAEAGHLDVIIWIENTFKLKPTVQTTNAAAKGGQVVVLEWLKNRGTLPDSGADEAVFRDDVVVLGWLKDNANLLPTTIGANNAATTRCVKSLEWMMERDIRPDSNVVASVTARNFTEVIELLRRHGWNTISSVVTPVVQKARAEILKLVYTAGKSTTLIGDLMVATTLSKLIMGDIDQCVEYVRSWMRENGVDPYRETRVALGLESMSRSTVIIELRVLESNITDRERLGFDLTTWLWWNMGNRQEG